MGWFPSGTILSGNTSGSSVVRGEPLHINGGSNITVQASRNTLYIHGAAAGTAAGSGPALSAGTQSGNTGTIVFANSNGITFGMDGSSQITASVNAGLTSQSNQAASAANGSFTFQTLSFGPGDGVSFSTGTQGIYGSVFTGYAASTHSHGNPTLALTNLSGTTASASNGLTLSLSANNPAAGSISFSAGTESTNAAGFTFANSNGISFGMSAQVVTASHNGLTTQSAQAVSVPAGSSTFQTLRFTDSNGVSWGTGVGGVYASVVTSYAASDHSHGNPSLYLTNLSGTTNSASNGLSISLSAANPAAAAGIAGVIAGTQTATSGTVAFVNSNGVSFGMNASQITASHNGLTTAAATDHSHGFSASNGSATFRTLSFLDSNGVSWSSAPGGQLQATVRTDYASSSHSHGNPTLALTNLSGTTNSASNGFTLSLSAAAPGAGGGIAAGAGTQTATSGTVVFANSNNVTFGMSGSTQVTASIPSSSIVGATGLNVSSAGSTISVYQQPASLWYDHPPGLVSSSQQTNSQMTIRRMVLPAPIVFTRIDIPVLLSIGSSAANNTANIVFTSGLGIYTRNGATLNPITGSIGNTTYTWASNTANYSSILGGRLVSFPLQSTLTEGEYYIVAKISTANNSSIGTATTQIANTVSVLIGSTYTALNFAEFGVVTGASTTGLAYMQGLCSVNYTGTAQTFQQSQISMSGAPGARANIHLQFRS